MKDYEAFKIGNNPMKLTDLDYRINRKSLSLKESLDIHYMFWKRAKKKGWPYGITQSSLGELQHFCNEYDYGLYDLIEDCYEILHNRINYKR